MSSLMQKYYEDDPYFKYGFVNLCYGEPSFEEMGVLVMQNIREIG